MATIGLDRLYYATITEDADGIETYADPQILSQAIKADLSLELAEATLYADDGASEVVKEFKDGKLTLDVKDLTSQVLADLTGATTDDNGVVVSASEDGGSSVAIAFRAKQVSGSYRYFWLYKVKFGMPSTSLQTKGDSITFQTPTIEGVVMRRNKTDDKDTHPWKAEANEDDTDKTTISNWYTSVYEPSFTDVIEE